MLTTPASLWGEAEDGSLVRVAIRGDRSSYDEILGLWPPFGLKHLDHDPQRSSTLTLDDCSDVDRIESNLALFTAEHMTSAVVVHAGLVDIGGHRVLFPGPSHAGKSTLIASGQDSGWIVLSDEFAVVEPDTGFACGWNRDMRIRSSNTGSNLERRPVTSSASAPIDFVVDVAFVPGAEAERHVGSLSLRPITPSESALVLLANTVCARTQPDRSFQAALTIARSAVSWSGTRGETQGAVPALVETITRPSRFAGDNHR